MDRRQDLTDALDRNMVRTVDFFQALSSDQLAVPVYHDGAQWTVQQVVAHLVTIERSMHWLFNNIMGGGEGSPKDFDVDRFNQSQTAKLDGVTIDGLLEQFQQVRRQTMAMVAAMTEADLDRQGHHAFHGQGRLERFIRWAHEHTSLHLDDIQSVLNQAE